MGDLSTQALYYEAPRELSDTHDEEFGIEPPYVYCKTEGDTPY